MRNGTASQLLTNSFSGGDDTESVIHIQHREESDESTAVSRVLSTARHERRASKRATNRITPSRARWMPNC